MRLFWQKGYEATSIQDLVERMGINRFSLYSTFGGKRRLFLKTLDRYRDVCVTALFGIVEQPEAALPEVRGYLERLVTAGSSPAGRMGCLMTNSAAEVAPHDRKIKGKVEAHVARLTEGFRRALVNARRKQQIGRRVDIDAAARYLAVSVLGLSVYAKLGPGETALEQYVESVLSKLH